MNYHNNFRAKINIICPFTQSTVN